VTETEANPVREQRQRLSEQRQRLSLRDQRLPQQKATDQATWLGAIHRCSHVQRLLRNQRLSSQEHHLRDRSP
jgi:hypothetical protein